MPSESAGMVRIAALGDLMLAGQWHDVGLDGRAAEAFRDVRALVAEDDVVFANLETTIEAGDGRIDKEPLVLGRPESVCGTLAALGVGVVNLANNHAFDGRLAGFEEIRALLVRERVGYFGAGRSAAEAARPLVVERGGVRLGWLGYVATDTRPSHVASAAGFGANPLVPERALEDVSRLRRDVDHVVVSLHWGVEYCHVPSPEQIRVARALVDRGASVILGHHAHVVQGVETYRDGVIAYGLGNATTTDFDVGGRLAIKQSRRTRSALVVRVRLDRNSVLDVEAVPIRCVGSRLVVRDAYAARMLGRANRALRHGGSVGLWRVRRLLEDVVLRTAWKLDPRVIRSLRIHHVGRLLGNVVGAVSGRGPTG